MAPLFHSPYQQKQSTQDKAKMEDAFGIPCGICAANPRPIFAVADVQKGKRSEIEIGGFAMAFQVRGKMKTLQSSLPSVQVWEGLCRVDLPWQKESCSNGHCDNEMSYFPVF